MNRRRARYQFEELARELIRPSRPNPLVALYRWRYEVATVLFVPLTLVELAWAIGPLWLVVVLVCLASTVAHWPAARRFVLTHVRSVIVQHRLRAAFTQARVCSLAGRRPAIMWTTPREHETRVLLWCPAGVDVHTVRTQRQLLAAACFASEVEVTRHPRFAHLVRLSIRTGRPHQGINA